MFRVPVVNSDNQPLMPTTLLRAKRWIASRKATPFWKKGVFCVRLNQEPSDNKNQDICVGVDPGSKREAFTVKSKAHTYLNVLTNAVDWVKDAVETRRNMRRARRFRNTRYRQTRFNNRKGQFLSPSTRARWDWKLRVLKWLNKIFLVTSVCCEDVGAKSKKNCKKWNKSFSPLEVGKNWFYDEVRKLCILITKQGFETKELRDNLGLKKSSSKLADKFECHNVDSWVLANSIVGGHTEPENKEILKKVPLRFHRRQLHVFQFAKQSKRKSHGSTRSLGFKRGSLIKHTKYGLCYVGGTISNRISAHCVKTGSRLAQNIKPTDCKFLCYSTERSCRLSSTG